MMQKFRGLLRLFFRPAFRQPAPFDGRLLDQRREDVFLVMHQIGLIR